MNYITGQSVAFIPRETIVMCLACLMYGDGEMNVLGGTWVVFFSVVVKFVKGQEGGINCWCMLAHKSGGESENRLSVYK